VAQKGKTSRGNRIRAGMTSAPIVATSQPMASFWEYLDLQEASADDGSLVQLCIVDHSISGHLHVQCHFRGGASSPWQQFNGVTMAAIRHVLASRRRGNGSIRLHLHTDKPKNPPASDLFVKALPRVTLSEASAALLQSGDGDAATCNVCLEEYKSGDELVCMPCRGLHKYHAQCIAKWLSSASTCPCCQWAVPKAQSDSQLMNGMEQARVECERLTAARAPPCQLVDDDEAVLTSAAESSDEETFSTALSAVITPEQQAWSSTAREMKRTTRASRRIHHSPSSHLEDPVVAAASVAQQKTRRWPTLSYMLRSYRRV